MNKTRRELIDMANDATAVAKDEFLAGNMSGYRHYRNLSKTYRIRSAMATR